jgi:hypothetical protein
VFNGSRTHWLNQSNKHGSTRADSEAKWFRVFNGSRTTRWLHESEHWLKQSNKHGSTRADNETKWVKVFNGNVGHTMPSD